MLCGVFDGHGKNGHFVSKAIKQRLPLLIIDQKNAVSKANEHYSECQSTTFKSSLPTQELREWEEACMNAFEEMDEEIKMVKKLDYSFSGSTAVIALKQVRNFQSILLCIYSSLLITPLFVISYSTLTFDTIHVHHLSHILEFGKCDDVKAKQLITNGRS